VIWDFDETLAFRSGKWSGTLVEVLKREMPEHPAAPDVTINAIRPYMQTGFPWNRAGEPHTPPRSADEWWEDRLPMFEHAFRQGAGLEPEAAQKLARLVRAAYIDPAAWRLFDDALPVLRALRSDGWRHVILSNHVPELSALIGALGLAPLIDRVFNSAETGFEKPHPEAFLTVLNAIGNATKIWMVGDSVSADIRGAKSVGLPSILVRSRHPDASHCCDTLTEIPLLVGSC
jgi:putative hydrolase of the HAD superfamily